MRRNPREKQTKRLSLLRNDTSHKIIAVIAGSGALPLRIVSKLKELREEFVVISLAGFGSLEYPQFEIGEIGKILAYIKERGVTDIVFCGAVKRPSIFSINLDETGKQWLRKLGIRAFLGDDALLKGIRILLANEGLNILRPQEILSTLLTPPGILTRTKPTEMELKDIARGLFVLNMVAKADVGQALVVQEGIVLAIEAKEGTSEMLRRTEHLKLTATKGGVMIKTAKTNQDEAIDLPTIGKQTISEARAANIAGIALGAHKTQIIDFDETIDLADKNDIFIIGVEH